MSWNLPPGTRMTDIPGYDVHDCPACYGDSDDCAVCEGYGEVDGRTRREWIAKEKADHYDPYY